MRRVYFDVSASKELQRQIDYLIDANAAKAAARLESRVRSYLCNYLVDFPKTGRIVDEAGLWECWIPRTRLIVWYRFSDDELQIVHVWHTSQDRGAS